MARTPVLLVPGGYGVFGRQLVERALTTLDCRVVVAGRDLDKAERYCTLLGSERVSPAWLDLDDEAGFREAVEGVWAVACTAGPFQNLDRRLPRWTIEGGAHWLDIADDSQWVVSLLEDTVLGEQAAQERLSVLPGLSTVPTLSGILGRAMGKCESERVTITLYIGNQNAKGVGAIASALQAGFDQAERVQIAGEKRWAYRFHSPDEALFPRFLGLTACFQVAFEWKMANWLMAGLQALAKGEGEALVLARWLAALAKPVSGFGSRLGVLQLESRGRTWAWVGEGQRMAILPMVKLLQALRAGEPVPAGCQWAAGLFPVDDWRSWLLHEGVEWVEA